MGSYKALYRKYRPQTFSEVVDQEYVTKTLKNAINAGKISHAYLFNGPRGIGKTSIARIFAKAINCENSSGAEPCCECEICKSIVDGSNPDIIEIDAASRTKVEQMRDTLEKVSFLPSICKYKVYIIDEVHMLSQSSFNALLKTLEEPPAHVVFILCTTEVDKVIPTIRSRCQRFDFHLISNDTMEERLRFIANQENINIENDALSLIVDAAEGGMRDALSLLDQISSFSVTDTITAEDVLQISGELSTESLINIASAINVNDSSKAISYLDELVKEGKDIEKITQGLITFFKDILVINNVKREIKKVGYSRFDFKYICDSLPNAKIFKFIDVLTETMSDYRFSSNKKLYLELAIIKMCDQTVGVIPKSTPIDVDNNKSTREPYDPNRVYVGIKKEPERTVVEEQAKPVNIAPNTVIEASPSTKVVVDEKKVDEKPQVSEIKETTESVKEEPKQEEVVEPATIEPKKEEKKDDNIDLYAMFGDLLEVQEVKKQEPVKEAEPTTTEPQKEDLNESVESDKEEPVELVFGDETYGEKESVQEIEPSTESVQEEESVIEQESQTEPALKMEQEPVNEPMPSSNEAEVLDDEENVEIVMSFDDESDDNVVKEENVEPVKIEEAPKAQEAKKEEQVQNKEPELDYDVTIIENVLNNSDKLFKESVISKVFNCEKDTRGTDLHKFALLFEDGNIVASSRERFILTFREVGHCNLVMKEGNYEGVKELIKELSGENLNFIAIPDHLWKNLSDQFIIKYKENRQMNVKEYITLKYVPCPGLKCYESNSQDDEQEGDSEEDNMKKLQELFGDTFKLE